MQVCTLEIREDSYRNSKINIRSCGKDFFPEDSFGGSTEAEQALKLLTLTIDGIGREVKTDIPRNKDGSTRWFFRDRSWVREFIDTNKLKVGDKIIIEKLSKMKYHLYPAVVKKQFTFIDLFAGIGGIRKGFEFAGGKCVYSSEWDVHAQKTYEANFGEVPDGDITKKDEKEIPDHDILTAGFPCQPFSIAGVSKKNSLGRKHGFADETQGTLFFDILRILKEKQPKAFLLENVRNLTNHDNGRTFKIIIDHLEELGYSVKYKIINGQLVVPQHRKRIYIIGTKPALNFEFPTDEEIIKYRIASTLGEILDKNVPEKYTLTDHLWSYLQEYKKKHQKAGNGFGFGLVGPDNITRTLSARYYKDGSEILIKQKGKNPRRLTPWECARLMGFDGPEERTFKIDVSDMQAYKQFGNSVVVPVIKAVACKLINTLQENRLL